MYSLQKQLFTLALAAIGLSAATGISHGATATGSASISQGLEAPGNTVTTTVIGATTPTAAASSAMSASGTWNLSTGAHAPDLADTSLWLPLSISLDSLTISTTSPRLRVSETSETTATVFLDGEAVITLARDEHGLNIRSTAPDTTKIAYQLTGSGTTPITLHSRSDYKLKLTSVTLHSPDGPALNLQSASTAFIELNGTSTLTDTAAMQEHRPSDANAMDLKATLFAEGGMVISGSGALKIEASTRHALASKRHLRIIEGNVTLKANAWDGIRASNAFIMDGGTLDISALAGKGIKVDGRESRNDPLGFIAINNGTLGINSHGKAITASWEAKLGKTASTDDDPDPRVTINGGTLHITTTGTPFKDTDTADGNDSLSPEGIESKSVLTINGGVINIASTDDSLNAGSSLILAGGRINLISGNADAADSNGNLNIAGGYIVARGAAFPEGAFDADTNTLAITGGTLIGIGGSSTTPSASASTQNTLVINDNQHVGLWTLRDADGNAVFSFNLPAPPQSTMVLSAPTLTTGTTYTVVTGGTLEHVAENFHGLAIEPGPHAGGTASTSVTLNQRVTTLDTTTQPDQHGG
ncbi:MAG: carbohydrate-binding domain-containing protein [Lautropia sp.]|nr:carbohydrate-binding domain-containing protein [Lautropia sp.]